MEASRAEPLGIGFSPLGASDKEGFAVVNIDVGLVVVIGPVILAIIVLVAIELTDRIPFPQRQGPDEAASGQDRVRQLQPRP